MKAELTRFASGLGVQSERKNRVRGDHRWLNSWNLELQKLMGKTALRSGRGGVVQV